MGRKIRESREDDQENAQKAFDLILEFVEENDHIEISIWAATFFNVLAHAFKNSGYSHEEFCEEIKNVARDYKSAWDL